MSALDTLLNVKSTRMRTSYHAGKQGFKPPKRVKSESWAAVSTHVIVSK